jgi:hypothetical protein
MYYRPRMAARLSVPVWGSSQERIEQEDGSGLIEFEVNVRKASISRNDHNHADEAEITVDWLDAGVDPRLMSNAIVEVFIGNADDDGGVGNAEQRSPIRRDRNRRRAGKR